MCLAHGGIYTKLGQYVSTLNHILPKAFIETLKPLTDKAKPMSINAVRRVIQREFGVELSHIFSEFDVTPIAAASLAQVYTNVFYRI